MITTKDFVWLHFPKCAGTTTERFLQTTLADEPSARFDPIDMSHVIWHQSIPQREKLDPAFELGAREVVCNIRRLPPWLLSRVYFESARPPFRTVTRAMLLRGAFYENSGHVQTADDYVKHYANPRVDHWIRTETLYEDMIRVFDRFRASPRSTPPSKQREKANVSKVGYIQDLAFYFSKAELAQLYDCNPVWARLEERVYGSRLTID